MPLSLVPQERTFRATGCDARCEVVQALVAGRFGRSELLLHDPTAHEEYGRGIASLLGDATRLGAVHSGGIAIDLDACTVSRDGSPLAVSPSEIQILTTLARRAGTLVPYDQVAFAVWGAGTLELLRPVWLHPLRVVMSRLRAQLRPWGGLIHTVPTFGYRLDVLPADAAPPPTAGNRPVLQRWAEAWDHCRSCGGTDRRHATRGHCARCRWQLHAERRWPPPENEEDA
ncbi:MAG: winged helix-turn-helix domain-containing protein [Solirubrobacteraceae bacterium]